MEIKKKRESAGLTQRMLSEKMGVSRTTVAMWESGAASPSTEKLPKLARILGCTIDALFGRTAGEEADKA